MEEAVHAEDSAVHTEEAAHAEDSEARTEAVRTEDSEVRTEAVHVEDLEVHMVDLEECMEVFMDHTITDHITMAGDVSEADVWAEY